MPDDLQIDEQNDGFDDGLEPRPPLNQLTKNQKIAAASLAVFAVLIVILWSVQLKNNIYGPLNSNSTGANEAAQIDSQTANDLALKNKDTDSDGLSDYDELNIYKTSPYLDDSDSDGVKDGEDIAKGTAPNCPAGRACASSEFTGDSAGTSAPASSSDVLNNLSDQSQALDDLFNQSNAAGADDSNGSADLTSEQIEILKNIDAASLREMLIEAGMDKDALDQISDAELMQSYNETLR